MNDRIQFPKSEQADQDCTARTLEELLSARIDTPEVPPARERVEGVVIGTLAALRDVYEPLVVYAGQPGTAALPARTTIDLYGKHIGSEIVLMFEDADPLRPIVMGLVRRPTAWPLPELPTQVELDTDDTRLVVNAKDQVVLKCGKASITLTAAGKILVQGTHVLHRSSGVMRIKGGSVQIN